MQMLETAPTGVNPALFEDRFTTLREDPSRQFPLWRDFLSPVMAAEPQALSNRGFRANVRARRTGHLQMASISVDGMKSERTEEHLRRDGIDHWQLVLRKSGSETYRSGSATLESTAGTLDLRTYAKESTSVASKGDIFCVWFDRDSFGDLASKLDGACHRPIDGAMGHILKHFLLCLEKNRKGLKATDLDAISNSLSSLLSAALKPCCETLSEADKPICTSLLGLARQFIDANLQDPDLNAESLCKHLMVSRRKLYYVFQEQGGVSTFIRSRRLSACHRALANRQDERFISTIAYDHGFTDAAQFSRLFRNQYGYTPRDAREASVAAASIKPSDHNDFSTRADGVEPEDMRPTFADWLLSTRN